MSVGVSVRLRGFFFRVLFYPQLFAIQVSTERVSWRYYLINNNFVDNYMDTYLPARIREYLNSRGLDDTILDHNKITWDGERIVIPIFNADGLWLYNKYRRDPARTDGPKYSYDKGGQSALYGIDKITNATQIILAEGELEVLILETNGFVAVSSTGGAGTFKQEWIDLLLGKDLFICFDNDEAGRKGMERVTKMCPTIKCIPLPREVGDHGDVTDFFIKLKKTRKDFEILMKVARPLELPPEPKKEPRRRGKLFGDKMERAKSVPLDQLLEFNKQGFALCPYHTDHKPTLHWIKKSNRFHCFADGENGDAIDLAQKLYGFNTVSEAINYLLTL